MKSYVPFLSLRYLWFHKVSSGLGILGVTLGVGLIIVVVGVMDGFQTRLKNSLIGSTAAVVVRPRYDVDVARLRDELKKVPGVVEASPVVYAMTMISVDEETRSGSAPCRIIGIDAEREDAVSGLGEKLHYGGSSVTEKGAPAGLRLLESASIKEPFRVPADVAARYVRIRAEKQGLVLGKNLSVMLDVRQGDEVRLVTGKRKPSKGNGSGRGEISWESEVYLVTGVFDVGDTDVDQGLVLMDRRDALSYFSEWLPFEADEVRLKLTDSGLCDDVKRAIQERAVSLAAATCRRGAPPESPLDVRTWKDVHRKVLGAVDNERGLLLVITSFSFIVVAFLIGSTQSMLVVEKTREIGVLRSLGASVPGTSAVFLGNGFFIGLVGAAAGCAIGVAVTSNIHAISVFITRETGRELFDPTIYRFDRIPIDVQPDFVLSICGGAVLFALLGSLLPAIRAATLDPVESLQHE